MARVYDDDDGKLVRIECDGHDREGGVCEDFIVPNPDIAESGWTKEGAGDCEWAFCPLHSGAPRWQR